MLPILDKGFERSVRKFLIARWVFLGRNYNGVVRQQIYSVLLCKLTEPHNSKMSDRRQLLPSYCLTVIDYTSMI